MNISSVDIVGFTLLKLGTCLLRMVEKPCVSGEHDLNYATKLSLNLRDTSIDLFLTPF